MNRISKLRLLTTVSGLAAAALVSSAASAANVGTATTNTTTVSGAGSLFLFDTNAGTLTNSSTGSISATSGRAIDASGTNTATINNSGNIEASFATSGVGSTIVVNSGSTITNGGTIKNIAAGGHAITISDVSGSAGTTINNTGTISAIGSGVAISTVFNSQQAITVTNSGTISGSIVYGETSTATASFTQTAGSISSTGTSAISNVNSVNLSGGTITGGINYRNDINGSNTYTQSGGTLTSGNVTFLTGTNTVNLSGGTLNGNIVGGSGADTVNISGGTLLGTIDGGGTTNDVVNFNGTGTKTLTTAISNVENINFNAGTTNLNAGSALGSTLATITGVATVNLNNNITSTTLNNAGTLNLDSTADSTNRTLTGNYTQTAAGILALSFDDTTTATNNSTLKLSGGATFAQGSTIRVNVAPLSTTFTTANITGDNWLAVDGGAALTVTGGTIANLNIVSSNPLIKFTASAPDANDIRLTAAAASATEIVSNVQNATAAGAITTANLQTAAGGGVAATNTTAALAGYGSYLSNLGANNVTNFNTINTAFNALTTTQQVADAIGDLQADPALVTAGSTAVSAATTASGNVIVASLVDARSQMANAETGASAGDTLGSDLRLWAQPFGSHYDQDKKQGIEGFEADTYGVVVGGDVAVSSSVRGGLAFSYSNTNVDGKGANAANGSDIDGYNVSLYGTYTPIENLFIDGLLGYGFNRYDSDRDVAFLVTRAKGDYDCNTCNARLGLGYDLAANGFVVTPSTFVNFTRVEQDSYTETGSLASVHVNDQETDRAVTGLGLKFAYPIQQAEGLFTPSANVGYTHDFGDKNQSVTQNFVGGSNFTTTGADIDRNAGQFGLGADYETMGGTVVTLNGQYEARSNADGFGGFVRVKAPF